MNSYTKIVTDKFLNTVHSFNMLKGVETVVIGFSGGADSVCLLHLLNGFKSQFGYNIKAIHINHGIRGEEATRDQLFAQMFCGEFQIPFEAVCVNCIAEAENSKESIEECGRRLRYKTFNEFAVGNSKIATAHNANDNAETVMFNIARGTTIKGLCGIPFVRDNIIRPILTCSRSEIEGYCKENGLTFVTDSTNLSDEYTRNKIRHNILPVLEELNPTYLDSISALKSNAFIVSDFISAQTEALLNTARISESSYRRAEILNSHKAVALEALFKAYKDFSGKTPENKKVGALYDLLENGGRIQIYGNDFAEVKRDYIRFYKVKTEVSAETFIVNSVPYFTEFNSYIIQLEKKYNNSKFVNQKDYQNMLDYNSVVGELVLRTRRAGDEFTLSKRGVTKTLKKLFTEANIPVEIRGEIPVLSDSLGVVWVFGFGVNKRCLPTKNSNNIVIVRGEYNDK